MATLKQTLKQLTTSKNYYFKQTGRDVYLYRQGKQFNICHANDENTMKHYLRGMTLCKGLIKINADTIGEMANAMGMVISLYTYGRGNIDKVLNDRYMQGYDLSEDVKRVLAEYIINAIESVKTATGEDGEGNTYNSCYLMQV